ncbi:helix-turn-helix transcriptional regulator [Streptomyces sp. NBC_00893]|uniref:helix-turn-helix domain-containing protein n=1 Tax=Streptomyces sp. NBC_00893 TaxID=2975862 RepID=UPI002255EB94|nr:helix-turn-helix transcriptional regulator [Streptomyces sp. NBC_00893]MCX4845601.1 helix-turn-helix transcriptional regulator [Streptomyces sp. NBC_00893]
MPPRSAPTERQRRLGAELRKMRTAADMTTETAARALGVPRTNIPNMESGRSGISADRVRAMAETYGCQNDALIEALAAMTARRRSPWWDSHRDSLPAGFLDVAEMEWYASRLRIALTVHMPGLFHTEDHARAVFEHVIPPLAPADIEARMALRLERRQVLDKTRPPSIELIMYEAALRTQFGGPKVARGQLRHILDMSEQHDVTLHAIPFSAGGFPGAGQSVIYAEGPVPELDTVELDSTHGPEFYDSAQQLRKYRAQLGAMREVALDPCQSRDFILAIANDL